LNKEREELREDPAAELNELAALYEAKGLSTATARTVAEELTDHDAFAAHPYVELGIDPDELTNPRLAALSYTVGALLPVIAILAALTAWRIPVTVVAVLLALAITYVIGHVVGAAIT
jgi:VIT1/CCC1 family predicted Fe2+/Mn2+ transporter